MSRDWLYSIVQADTDTSRWSKGRGCLECIVARGESKGNEFGHGCVALSQSRCVDKGYRILFVFSKRHVTDTSPWSKSRDGGLLEWTVGERRKGMNLGRFVQLCRDVFDKVCGKLDGFFKTIGPFVKACCDPHCFHLFSICFVFDVSFCFYSFVIVTISLN